ncbi:50S ribosome-binding GTPase [Candidatus Vidania fulgoroideae]|nr:50S ribosome-binding GTPase [Candidatus Vidania fulgoroideae]
MKTQHPIISETTNIKYKTGIAGIKISAGKYNLIIKKIFKTLTRKLYIFPRLATYSKIYIRNKMIDDGIIIFFNKECSYTGEDTLEIFTHGNKHIVNSILRYCIKKYKKYNLRKAQKGEFIERAYLNKKIDVIELKRLESILIKTKDATKSLKISNTLRHKIKTILKNIFNIRLCIENYINFKHSNDNNYKQLIVNYIRLWLKKIQQLRCKKITIFKTNIKVALVGHTNVGKSTLFNKLITKNKSLCEDYNGTTKNIITQVIRIGKKIQCKIIDTPGYPKSSSNTHTKIKKNINKVIQTADIILNIHSPCEKPKQHNKKVINIINKIDMVNKKLTNTNKTVLLSCKNSGCYNYLYHRLLRKIYKLVTTKYLIARAKARATLKSYIRNTLKQTTSTSELTTITNNLGMITKLLTNIFNIGNTKKISTEFFRRFCIGK